MLTKRQRETLDFIRNYINKNGEAPVIQQVADALGLASRGVAHRYVKALIEGGYLENHPTRARGLKLVEHTEDESLILPLMGKIAAGRLIEAIPDESSIDVGRLFFGSGRYVLKISGESMINAGILNGDYVVIDSNLSPKYKDIAVALVDGYDATLKTILFNHDGKTITLQPENPKMEPVTIAAERIRFQGVMVGQFRVC